MNALRVSALQALAPQLHVFGAEKAHTGEANQLDYHTLHSLVLPFHDGKQREENPDAQQWAACSATNSPDDRLQINVTTLAGRAIAVHVRQADQVREIQHQLHTREQIRPVEQRLIFRGKELDPSHKINECGLCDGSTIILILRLTEEGKQFYQINPNIFHRRFDYDFTNITEDMCRRHCKRGADTSYMRPCGWKKLAIRIDGGRYGTDCAWLEKWRHGACTVGQWPVSYHGTVVHPHDNGTMAIAVAGFRCAMAADVQIGAGIYTTPDIKVAEAFAATHTLKDGTVIKVVLQNRVNPNTLQRLPFAPQDVGGEGVYWVSPSPDDVRPYGICVKVVHRPKGAGVSPSVGSSCTIM